MPQAAIAPIAEGGLSLAGSLKNQGAQSSQNSQNNALINSLIQQGNATAGPGLDFLKNLTTNPMQALGPIFNALNAQFNQGATQGVNTLRNDLGSQTPNLGGSINDLMNNILLGRVNLGIGEAGQGAQAQMGAAGQLGQFGQNDINSALQFLTGQQNRAATTPNPFAGFASFLSQNPNIFGSIGGGGGGGGGSQLMNPGAFAANPFNQAGGMINPLQMSATGLLPPTTAP